MLNTFYQNKIILPLQKHSTNLIEKNFFQQIFFSFSPVHIVHQFHIYDISPLNELAIKQKNKLLAKLSAQQKLKLKA